MTKNSLGKGFSLLEVALAFALLSAVLFYTIATIAKALQLEIESYHLLKAMQLAQGQMNELLSDPALKPQEVTGRFEDASENEDEYTYELIIREDKIDLSKALLGNDSGDLLTSTLTEELDKNKERLGDEADIGKAVSTFTTYSVYRINLTVNYFQSNEGEKQYTLKMIRLKDF